MKSPFNINEFRDSIQNLSIIYFIALSVIAVAATVSQVLIQTHLDSQKYDARVINIAGRQRMLSQKISKIALRAQIVLQQDSTSEEVTHLLHELIANCDLWKESHQGLLYGNQAIGVLAQNSPEISRMFIELEPHYRNMLAATEQVIQILQTKGADELIKLKDAIKVILAHDDDFLAQMDKIVFQYDKEATEQLRSLQLTAIILFSIMLTVLVLELILVFLPQAKRLNLSYNELRRSKEKANELAYETRKLYEGVRKSNREIKHINYALNEAAIIVKTDIKGYITEVNKKYCSLSGFTAAEAVGLFFEITPFSEKLFHLPSIKAGVSDELIWKGEEKQFTKNGEIYWLDITLIPIASAIGETYQFLAICNDITHRRAQEEKRFRESQDKYEKEINAQRLRSFAIITGQEKERKRMSREVHDGLGQVLTALKFRLESLQVTDEHEQKKLMDTKTILTRAISEVRRISSGLLPAVLNDYGLAAGIKDLVQVSSKQSGISIVFDNSLKIDHRLHRDVEVSLYRIAQEALNNALKYSKADTIQVTLGNDAEFITLSIIDNGKGFDLEQKLTEPKRDFSGNGLASIKERSNLIDGHLLISTSPGKGTNIYLEVPLTPENYEQNTRIIS
ncbi:MAG: ATP-binding protein [Flammeovirgaceae bacterium]